VREYVDARNLELFGPGGRTHPLQANNKEVYRLGRCEGRHILAEVTIKRGATTRVWDRNQVNIMKEIKQEFGDHDSIMADGEGHPCPDERLRDGWTYELRTAESPDLPPPEFDKWP
jgi:hypothetical protein